MSAERSGALVSAAAAALPVVLWHRVVADIGSQFRPEPAYLLTGWTCWALMALGLLCLVPASVADWRGRRRRFYRRGSGAWYARGITLDLLGFALATQVAQIADGPSAA